MIRTRLAGSGHLVTLVPVAAILVASIRLHFLDVTMNMNYRGAAEIDCDARFAKGDELGWFEHGSTIIVFAPPGSPWPTASGKARSPDGAGADCGFP